MKRIPELLISIDVAVISPSETDHYKLHPELDAILKLFHKYHVRATFFITTAWAEQYPTLTREMAGNHEIGAYVPAGTVMDPGSLKNVLQNITGSAVYGFRGPGAGFQEYPYWREAGYIYNAGMPSGWLNNWNAPRTMYLKDNCYVIPPSVSPLIRYTPGWPTLWYMPELVTKYFSNSILRRDGMLSCNFDLVELSDQDASFNLVLKRLDGFLCFLQTKGTFYTHIEWLQEQLYE